MTDANPDPQRVPDNSAVATERPRRRWAGSLIAIGMLIALGILAWYLTHRPPVDESRKAGASGRPAAAGPPRGAPPSTVGIAIARHASIPVIVEALGTVTSVASVTVTPQVSGVITQVLYTEGQMVKKGQVLATIDPRPFQATLNQAAAARQRDEAQLDAAKQLLGRYQTLRQQDSIAGQTVDTQAALVKQLAATVAVDRANEEMATLNLQWSQIKAPVAGRIGLRPVDAGNFIAAGNTTGVATITQVSPINVEFAIPQGRLPDLQQRIKAGATLPITAWDSARTRQLAAGVFATVDNQIDIQTGTIKAKALFKNDAGTLFPNQFVNVRLLLNNIDAAVVVPVTALRFGPNGNFVYVINDDQTVTLRNVSSGLAGVDDVEITKGLVAGERVVTEGGDRLKDGARVQTGAAARPASGAASGSSRGGRRPHGSASGAASSAG